MTSTRASTASGSSRIPTSGSKCSFTPASASRRNSLPMVPTNGFAASRPTRSRSLRSRLSRRKSPPRCQFHPAPRAFPTTRREAQMPNKVTFYAVVNDLSSREQPSGVFRRTYTEDGGKLDEAFTRKLTWERSWLLVSAERGDLANEFIEITEDEANQIVERIRAKATGANNGYNG